MIAPRQRHVALLVAGCFFMEMPDGTIVTTSAPQIASSLAVPANSVSFIVTAYTVTLAALIPASGWMSARWGARRVFLSAIGLFTLASLGCAVSGNLAELVVMRVLQGAGGAMMVPVGRLVVLAKTEKAHLMTVTAYLIWPALIAPVIAPLAGGVITTYASWHWLFLINVPLGVFAILAALRLIDSPLLQHPPPLDIAGVVLSCGGLAGLTVTAGVLTEATPQRSLVLAIGLPSTVILVLAIRHLLRSRAPLIEIRTLRIHTLRSALVRRQLDLLSCRRSGTVSRATAVPGGVRMEPDQVRRRGPVRLCRQRRDQAGNHLPLQQARISRDAHRFHCADGSDDGDHRVHYRGDTRCRHRARPGPERSRPIGRRDRLYDDRVQ
jgi:MFS family permease